MGRSVGEKLRALRRERKITLEEFADKTGFSYSYLSNLENGKHSITVTNLAKIADFFAVDMTYFFEPERLRNKPIIIKKGEEQFLTKDQVIFQGLTPTESRLFRVTLAEFTETAQYVPEAHAHFSGEELVHVLSGKVLLTIEGTSYPLEAGDSIFFRSELAHEFAALVKPANLIIVLAYF